MNTAPLVRVRVTQALLEARVTLSESLNRLARELARLPERQRKEVATAAMQALADQARLARLEML